MVQQAQNLSSLEAEAEGLLAWSSLVYIAGSRTVKATWKYPISKQTNTICVYVRVYMYRGYMYVFIAYVYIYMMDGLEKANILKSLCIVFLELSCHGKK